MPVRNSCSEECSQKHKYISRYGIHKSSWLYKDATIKKNLFCLYLYYFPVSVPVPTLICIYYANMIKELISNWLIKSGGEYGNEKWIL